MPNTLANPQATDLTELPPTLDDRARAIGEKVIADQVEAPPEAKKPIPADPAELREKALQVYNSKFAVNSDYHKPTTL